MVLLQDNSYNYAQIWDPKTVRGSWGDPVKVNVFNCRHLGRRDRLLLCRKYFCFQNAYWLWGRSKHFPAVAGSQLSKDLGYLLILLTEDFRTLNQVLAWICLVGFLDSSLLKTSAVSQSIAYCSLMWSRLSLFSLHKWWKNNIIIFMLLIYTLI